MSTECDLGDTGDVASDGYSNSDRKVFLLYSVGWVLQLERLIFRSGDERLRPDRLKIVYVVKHSIIKDEGLCGSQTMGNLLV